MKVFNNKEKELAWNNVSRVRDLECRLTRKHKRINEQCLPITQQISEMNLNNKEEKLRTRKFSKLE